MIIYPTFQSAPANYSGRIIETLADRDLQRLFQSAPATNYSGRIEQRRAGFRVGQLVSIRARQLQRANPNYGDAATEVTLFQSAPANYSGRILDQGGEPRQRYLGFNPRPPITAGESALLHHLRRNGRDVSIRARQLRRANLAWACVSVTIS